MRSLTPRLTCNLTLSDPSMIEALRARWVACAALAGLLGGCQPATEQIAIENAAGTEIRWDEWGVPHIRGATVLDTFYGFGWAQMRGRGDLVLKLLGQGRGRGAEYWGQQYLQTDALMWQLGIPQRLDALYETQGETYQKRLDAFAQGINDFAAQHPEHISEDAKRVLPVTARDVLGHSLRVLHATFIAGGDLRRIGALRGQAASGGEQPGSNAWAIAPSRSESGEAMLLANPHLRWDDFFYFFEAHLQAPNFNAYGVSLIGFPVLNIAFNEHLGWTLTVNTYDGADTYAFALVDNGYQDLDGPAEFQTSRVTLKVREEDGNLQTREIPLLSTSAGPVLYRDAKRAFALRIAGLEPEHSRVTQQFWEMGSASSLDEFEEAMAQLQLPMFNTVYADRHGETFYLFNALAPVRQTGNAATWSQILDGANRQLRWDRYLDYGQLPKVRNPGSGFLQNANEPPWTSTLPPALDPSDFPGDLVPPFIQSRPMQSLSLLLNDESITFEEFVDYSQSTHLKTADLVIEDLIQTARATGNRDADELLIDAADVLEQWDRSANVNSKGAVLFGLWINEILPGPRLFDGRPPPNFFETPWSFEKPKQWPSGVADDNAAVKALRRAAQTAVKKFGAVDAPWGEIAKVKRDGVDLSVSVAPSALGAFRSGWIRSASDTYQLYGGTTYVAAISFGDVPRAQGILPYGNFEDRPDTVKSQWEIFADGRLRTIHFQPSAIEQATVLRESLPVYAIE